jgi:hypothetical protein
LPEFGVRPTVLTIDPAFYEARDTTYATPSDVEIIRTGTFRHPFDLYRKLKPSVTNEKTGSSYVNEPGVRPSVSTKSSVLHGIKRNILLALKTPDPHWGWYWPALRAGLKFVRERKPEAIISSAPPWISHLVARGIHRRTGVRWIADFRDPWTLSPWRDALPPYILRFERTLERSIIEECDHVVCVSDEMVDDFRVHYAGVPSSKFTAITNGFEGEVDYPVAARQNGTRQLLHLGSLYGDRRIRPLLCAYVNLLGRGAIESDKCKLLFVGNINGEILAEASEEISFLQRLGVLEFRELVPYSEGQQLLASADVLLLLNGDNRVAVPAKLFEYLLTGKPILFTAKPGSLTRLISRFDLGFCADSDAVEEIGVQLQKSLESPPRTRAEFERIVQHFHFRTLTQELVGVMTQNDEGNSIGASAD